MNGTRSKQIRRAHYGDLSLRVRKYFINDFGQIFADPTRDQYQKLKINGKIARFRERQQARRLKQYQRDI
jgi:hypothetical protein